MKTRLVSAAKKILTIIGLILFSIVASIHDIDAMEFSEYAAQSGRFYGTAHGMDTVGVYSDYVIFYPETGEVEMDGKSIYHFEDMEIGCDLGEIVSDGEKMYLTVYLGDRAISYTARRMEKHGIVYYIFNDRDIDNLFADVNKYLGFNLD